jgi:hypothetical protein
LTSAGCLAAVATIAVPAEAVVYYDIDFGTPPHTVGLPPATGGGPPPRDTVSAINFGAPIVVSSLGALTDQPLKFDSFDLDGDQIKLVLDDLPASTSYTIECDVLIEQSTKEQRFAIFHDTPIVRNIEFIDGVVYAFIPGVNDPWPGDPIGNYTPGVPVLVRSEVDLATDHWQIFLDNVPAYSGTFGGATELRAVRVSTRVLPIPPGAGTLAAIDNLVVSAGICGPLFLDIKPGSCPNPLNRKSQGVLPVALLGTGAFDITQVDVSSVVISRADGTGGSASPNEGPPGPYSVFEDVGTPFDGEPCDCHDLGGDGITDLSMKFRTQEVVDALELDGLPGGELVELAVSGTLLDGTPFTASDCVWLVPPCPWDCGVPLDGQVNIPDLLVLLSAWGTDPGGSPDFDGDGNVGIVDFLELVTNWGPCPSLPLPPAPAVAVPGPAGL